MTLWLLCRAPKDKHNHGALLFMVLSKAQTHRAHLRTSPGNWSVRIKAAILMQGLLRQSSVTYLMCWTGVSHNWNPGEDIHEPEGKQQDVLHKPHDPISFWAATTNPNELKAPQFLINVWPTVPSTIQLLRDDHHYQRFCQYGWQAARKLN